MKSEQIGRGQLAIDHTPAALSHVRISFAGNGPETSYDEIAYRLPGQQWEVLASHLDPATAAAVFGALDGFAAEDAENLASAVSAIVARSR